MPSNPLTPPLSADERTIWSSHYDAVSVIIISDPPPDINGTADVVAFAAELSDAKILALRSRCAAAASDPFPVGSKVRVWGAEATVVSISHPGRYTVLCGDGTKYDVGAELVSAAAEPDRVAAERGAK